MRRCILLLVLAAGPALPAAAQPSCDASVDSAWLQPASDPRPATPIDATPIDATLVRPVAGDLRAAVGMLGKASFVALGPGGLARFAGPAGASVPADRNLRPYLVRAVFPTADPTLTLRWSGGDLHVMAAGLGCAPFTDHPLVVFLPRPPARVFVAASAAL